MSQGHNIFISYKYYDNEVYQKINHSLFEDVSNKVYTPRDYVNVLETYIKDYSPHYYKAEEDNNDLSGLSDEEIWEILKDKIFHSTLTIVLVSPNMVESKPDREQWIPWEIEYSLGIENRKNSNGDWVRSYTNAMMAIVLPDKNNSYSYYFENKNCCSKGCRLNKTDTLFYIMRKNVFNKIDDENSYECSKKDTIYSGKFHSYICFYKWDEINSKDKIEEAIKHAYEVQSLIKKYKICHEIEPSKK